ncbi:hypothetical protein CDL15_Pgr014194 [Punica granatum]|uniref:Uncharacterized protein n=1 Tax=Punica granatum TaxID=22663 RepID=A0A218XDC6_PUNGR|nr:hypothetical protein CDL15_Pgr014194 [Punica granatum]
MVMGVYGCEGKFKFCGGGSLEPPGLEMESMAWGCPIGAVADCGRGGRAELGGVEPWLGVEPRLDGSAWLSCRSHSVERKAGKCLRLD